MKILFKGILLSFGFLLLVSCGGGSSSNNDDEPEPPIEKTFSLQLKSADIRLSSNGEALSVDTDEVKSGQLTVR